MLSAHQIRQARQIEEWAHEQVTRHKRECRNAPECAGKSKVWWITRHPQTPDEIANKTAVGYVVSRQACELLEESLVRGVLAWLPGERAAYRRRSQEDRYRLLGRPVFQEVPEETTEVKKVSVRNFSDPEDSFLEVPRPKSHSAREETSGEVLHWVDSLTRRGR